ncbi:MAG: hypothetical protein MPF33_02945 [Candidatus Aramenus sp.]|nr:hypothetical protein [Candidatus Aramenus sp.]
MHFASLYANDAGRHIAIPLDASIPFLAVKTHEEVVNKLPIAFVKTRNPNSVPYSPE